MARWRAGELNQRIKIMEEVEIADGLGGYSVSTTEVHEVWAKVIPRQGNERFFGDTVDSISNYLFVIRNDSSLTISEKHRILFNNEEYNISMLPDPGSQSMYLEIGAMKGVAQ